MTRPDDELPAWARRLGHAGLLPFVGGALLVHLVWPEAHPYAVLALAAYAVAFTQAQPDPRLFAWGVVPSLVAWVAIVMPPSAGLVVLGVMLIACYAVDRRLYLAHGLQRWLVLRFRLSAVAALCCFLGAAGS
jgi:hypothetical protein